jgi:hypothetical protein
VGIAEILVLGIDADIGEGIGVWRDNLDENGAAIRMRSGGRDASWSRRTRTDASPL